MSSLDKSAALERSFDLINTQTGASWKFYYLGSVESISYNGHHLMGRR
jgi:hypothetical protein